ncbi:MAG TPA: hypothetical protein VJ789_01705 [Burkholderiales bacterium]|nr:hypothetical protein [Burkholderiales bacterium]
MRRLLVLAVVLLTGCASSSSGTGWLLVGVFLIGMEANNPTQPLADRPPPMDAARRVNEQDCTQPIVDASANLKCR